MKTQHTFSTHSKRVENQYFNVGKKKNIELRFFNNLAPGAPLLIPEECSAENNSVTVAWQAPQGYGPGQRGPAIEGYLLELDDGCGGEFRVRYQMIFLYFRIFIHII